MASLIQVSGVENLLEGCTELASRGTLVLSLTPKGGSVCISENLIIIFLPSGVNFIHESVYQDSLSTGCLKNISLNNRFRDMERGSVLH